MGPSGRFTHVIVILMFGTSYMQVLYLGRVPRTKKTLPDFSEKCRVMSRPRSRSDPIGGSEPKSGA